MADSEDKTIQGLYSWKNAEGYYWHLLAKVTLAQFIRRKVYQKKDKEEN